MPGHQVVKAVLVERNARRFALAHEYVEELLAGRVGHAQLVLYAPQESIVYQVFRVEVGGQDQEKLERNLQLLARFESEVIYPFFKGYDPAIEKRLRAYLLAAKVVNQEEAAVGLQLKRRFVEARVLVIYQVERRHRKFAAHHHHRLVHSY